MEDEDEPDKRVKIRQQSRAINWRTAKGNIVGGGGPSWGAPASNPSDGRLRGLPTGRPVLCTDPAGNPSFRGLPTGRLGFGTLRSTSFFPLPLGRPGVRLDTEGDSDCCFAAEALSTEEDG